MANLTNHINFNTSWGGGGDVTAGDAIRIDAGNEVNVKFDGTSITLNNNGELQSTGGSEVEAWDAIRIDDGTEVNVKFDNTSITLNENWELQATLPIHCIEDYPATVEWEIIINGCGCTAGELYRAVDDSDYYPENTKYFSIGQTQTKILSPETGKRFYFKRTEQKNAYTVTKVHDYKTNYNRYSDIYDDEVLCSADILDSVVAEIMTWSHNDHVLNLVLHNTIRTDSYYKSHWWFKYTSPIDWTTCYWQALHSSAELTEAWWTTNQVTRFENSIVTAIQSIDPTILNVTQFFSKYSVINSIAEEYHLYWHNIIIADNSTNKPVMYAWVSFSSSNDYECVYYRLNKIVDTFTLFRTYPKSWFAMMMYNGDGSWDDATYFSNYEYVLETTNQILSSGTIRTNSSATGSCYIGWDDVCSYTVSCNGSDNNILTSLMSTTDTAMWEPGWLVWEPVANCPEPEPEISIEAWDAIRIDNGTEVNVKFDGTTIVLNDNGELSSACCEDAYPEACVLESQPTEEWIIVQNNCWDTAWMLYKSVYRSSIPAGTNYLKIYFTWEHNIRDIVNYWNIEDIRTYTELYNKDFYDTWETVTKKVYKTVKREDENTYNGKYTYAYTQNYYLPEMITQWQLMWAPEWFRSNIFTGFDTRWWWSSSSYWVIATPQFTSNNKLNFYQITNAEALSNLYTEWFLELWMYWAKWPRADLDADRVAWAQTFLDTYDVYTRVLTTRTGNYPITMNEFYCYDKDWELKIIHSTQALQGHNIDTGQMSPKDLTVTSQLLDFHVYQSRNWYKMYYPGRLLENNAYWSTFMFFEDPAWQLMFASPIFITTWALNYNSRLYQSDYVPYTYLQATAWDQEWYYSRELYYTEDQQKVIQLWEQLMRLTDRFNTLETTLTAQIASLEERVTALENA